MEIRKGLRLGVQKMHLSLGLHISFNMMWRNGVKKEQKNTIVGIFGNLQNEKNQKQQQQERKI